MQWMTDNGALMLGGLVLFAVIFVVAFFVRNSAAKNEKNMSPDSNSKTGGDVPIQKSKK
jgi:hypothetical protein